METHTELQIGKQHGTEFWAITMPTGGVAIIKRRGIRDIEDSSIDEAAKKLHIPREKVLIKVKALQEPPKCPKCGTSATRCHGGTSLASHKGVEWICPNCTHEF